MTRDEVATFLRKIKSHWSNFPELTRELVTSWEESLKDRSYEDCLLALKMYQNPKTEEGVRNSRFYPHAGDINGICRGIEDSRIEVRSNVMNLAKRAVNNFPSNGAEERKEAIGLFCDRCMKYENPIEAAKSLKKEIDKLRIYASSIEFVGKLKPITKIVREAPINDK